jgi:hypothetical protein
MPDFSSRLPARLSFEQLRKQAKDLLRQYRAGETTAVERFRRVAAVPRLADAQFLLAREYGFESWSQLKHHVEAQQHPLVEPYIKVAEDLLAVCAKDDADALQRVNDVFGNSFRRAGNPFTPELLRERIAEHVIAIRGAIRGATGRPGELTLPDVQLFVARQYGFGNWSELLESITEPPASPLSVAQVSRPTTRFYRIDWQENRIDPGVIVNDKDWDAVFEVMKEQGITGINAGGRMTDSTLERLSRLEHVTRLNLDGSIQLSDEGIAHLERMPGLQELDLSGWKGRITDRGLQVLRHLPNLRRFAMCWQQNVTDAGIANLEFCEHLESVNLLGTPAGDGAIHALKGKQKLHRFSSGRGVTDAGLGLFHKFPAFERWLGGEPSYGLMAFEAGPTFLLIDGPFTDHGLQSLAGLEGLFGLTFFWHCTGFTSAGLEALKHLPRLGFLGCQDQHCDDEAMVHIAAIPGLRMLQGQGTVAGDAGFQALSRSKTLEFMWGRDSENLGSRGFAALAEMPSLKGIALSLRNVDDSALSLLPRFPSLAQLCPMNVLDDAFRHVGACKELENLWCMYCRETGDAATGHLSGLSRLKTYYAGRTLITDRSLEKLARMDTLEQIEFWQCAGITNAGVAYLASLPNLREISLGGLPGITREAVNYFPKRVRVNYSA